MNDFEGFFDQTPMSALPLKADIEMGAALRLLLICLMKEWVYRRRKSSGFALYR